MTYCLDVGDKNCGGECYLFTIDDLVLPPWWLYKKKGTKLHNQSNCGRKICSVGVWN